MKTIIATDRIAAILDSYLSADSRELSDLARNLRAVFKEASDRLPLAIPVQVTTDRKNGWRFIRIARVNSDPDEHALLGHLEDGTFVGRQMQIEYQSVAKIAAIVEVAAEISEPENCEDLFYLFKSGSWSYPVDVSKVPTWGDRPDAEDGEVVLSWDGTLALVGEDLESLDLLPLVFDGDVEDDPQSMPQIGA